MNKISRLVGRGAFSASVFYNANFCGSNGFAGDGKAGHLHLVRSGTIDFLHEAHASIRVTTPTLMFYPRGMNHRLQVVSDAASLLCANIVFEGGNQNLLARALPDILQLPLNEVPALQRTVDFLFQEADVLETGQDMILDRLCDVLIIQLIRHESRAGRFSGGTLPGLVDAKLAKALTAFHEQPDLPWSLTQLAALAGMSRSKFADYFHRVVGVPPGEYMMRWRLALAQDLLRQGVPVKLASLRAGYANQPAFTRMFRERVGMSPRGWLATIDGQSSPA